MKSRTWMLGSIFSLLVVLLVATSTVYAAPIRVDCGKGGSNQRNACESGAVGQHPRSHHLRDRHMQGKHHRLCAFDHLLLQASPIATLQDASNGTAPVVQIFNSYDVTLISFTINGGSTGVGCFQYSFCTLILNRIQQSVGLEGVRIARSSAILQNNNIVEHAGRGITVANGGKLLTSLEHDQQ